MNKNLIKEGLLLVANNKEEVLTMLEGIDGERGDRGVIKISEDFINISCRELVLRLAQDKVEDYHLAFRADKIYVEIVAKMVIKAKIRLVFTIEKFVFEPKKHEITISYEREGLSVANNFIPKIIEKIVNLNSEIISVDGNYISIDLDQLEEIPSCLALEYMEADMGTMEFAFLIV